MSCKVFMSYSGIKDLNGHVTKFREHLEWELRQKTGDISLVVFQDKREIHGGDKWEKILVEELASAQILLVLLSPTWLRSEWCNKEYQIFCTTPGGDGESRTIVPLMWDNVEDRDAKTEEQKRILADLRTSQVLSWEQYSNRNDWSSSALNKAADKLAEELKLNLVD